MIEFYSFETELITKLQTMRLAMQNHGVCYPWFSLLLFFCYNTILAFIHTTMSQFMVSDSEDNISLCRTIEHNSKFRFPNTVIFLFAW